MTNAPARQIDRLAGRGVGYLFAILATALAALARWAMDSLLADTSQYLMFYFSVTVVALVAGTGPGLLAILLGATVGTGYFVLQEHVGETWLDDLSRMVFFVLFGTLATFLARRLHEARHRADRTAEALRRSAEQIRLQATALESASTAIALSKTDPQGTIVWVNPAFTHLTGYTRDEVIGKTHRILSSGLQDEAFYRNLWDTITRGQPWHGELVNRRKDGTLYYEHMSITPVRDERGHITHFIAIKQDISARTRAETGMRESVQRFQFVTERAQVGYWHWDIASDQLEWSASCKRLFRIPEDDQVSYERFLAAVHPDDRQRVENAVRHCLQSAGDNDYNTEFRTRWPDGTIRWIHSKGSASFADGKPQRMAGIALDITDRKQAEEELARREQRFRGIFDNAAVGISLTDPQGRVLQLNRTLCHILGYSEPDVIGKTVWDLTHPDDLADDRRRYAKLMSEGGPSHVIEKRYRRKDGATAWLRINRAVQRDETGQPLYSINVIEDITDRKQAEEALAAAKLSAERAKAAAEQATRAKDQFLAVLSHELRTPLTPMLAIASTLKNDPRLEPSLREDVEMLERNVELEARLIDDLLDLTRIAKGKMHIDKQPLMVCTVLSRVTTMCKPDLDARRLHFELNIDNPPHWVHGDLSRLQQVFWNLIKNAIKFTPPEGCIRIRCWREGSGEGSGFRVQGSGTDIPSSPNPEPRTLNPEPSFRTLNPSSEPTPHVVIEVTDSGIGIRPELLPRLFNAFEQGGPGTTRQFGGLGLGLAISKTIVELHGGTIQARSDGEGKGATFTVRLPTADCQLSVDEPQPPSSNRQSEIGNRKSKILLVEDHMDTARIMRQFLRRQGHEVQIAMDVATALELAGAGNFDLLISDLGLPDHSGLDLLRDLRAHQWTAPAIALSGYGTEEDVRQSRAAGFIEHLTKPVNLDALRRVIQRVSSGSAV